MEAAFDLTGRVARDVTRLLAEQDAIFEPNGYRTSDHDPVIVGVNGVPVRLGAYGEVRRSAGPIGIDTLDIEEVEFTTGDGELRRFEADLEDLWRPRRPAVSRFEKRSVAAERFSARIARK